MMPDMRHRRWREEKSKMRGGVREEADLMISAGNMVSCVIPRPTYSSDLNRKGAGGPPVCQFCNTTGIVEVYCV